MGLRDRAIISHNDSPMHPHLVCALWTLFAAATLLVGCDEQVTDGGDHPVEPLPVEMAGPPPEIDGDEHLGPRGGQVIELGRNHKYHAELVEAHDPPILRVFVLDGDLNDLPIDATTLVLNLTTGGKTTSFEMASAQPGRESAEFLSTDAALFSALHAEGCVAKLRVSIQNATYVGTLDHAHECDCGHDHAH